MKKPERIKFLKSMFYISVLWSIFWYKLGNFLSNQIPFFYRFKVNQLIKPKNRQKISKNTTALVHAFSSLFISFYFFNIISPHEMYNCPKLWSEKFIFPASFMGYLLQDMFRDIYNTLFYKVPFRFDMFFHHSLYILFTFTQYYYSKGCILCAWLYLTEFSTIFLILRWFALIENSKKTNIYNCLFAISFFFSRVIVYGIGLFHFIQNDYDSFKSFYLITPFLVIFGYFLNIYWFSLIVKAATSSLKKLNWRRK